MTLRTNSPGSDEPLYGSNVRHTLIRFRLLARGREMWTWLSRRTAADGLCADGLADPMGQ